jgi:ribosome recycling factor
VTKQIVKDAEEKMKKSIEVFRTDLAGMKAGRATPALLDKIRVDYYGTPSPIKQVAAVEVSDSRTLTIKPYERNMIKAIEKAIQQSDLGINPNNDGIVIRLQIPAMTEDRRKEMVKVVHKRTEEERVVIRNIRRDANDHLKKEEKAKTISEDESKRAQDEIQKLTDKLMKEVEQILASKEKEIMEV